jgi:hypothetical protein
LNLAKGKTVNSFPALYGQPVTEAHTAFCAERGHASHTVNGAEQGICPRCGEITETPAVNPEG